MSLIQWYKENYAFKEDYVTSADERWDLISLALYGRSDLSHVFLACNGEIDDDDRYGLACTKEYTLKIPDIDLQNTENTSIPAWRRALNEGTQ